MAIEIGSQVTWTHTSKRGSAISMATKTGEVEAVTEAVATVITGRNRRRVQIPVAQLRETGQKTALTEFVEDFFAASRARQGGVDAATAE